MIYTNPSFLSSTRLPTVKVTAEPYSWPKDGWLPRWRVPAVAISSPHDVEDLEGDHEMSNTRDGSDEEVDRVPEAR